MEAIDTVPDAQPPIASPRSIRRSVSVQIHARQMLNDRHDLRSSARSRRELHDLHQASIAIGSDLNLESVLQRVVDTARRLVGAKYGAISWLDEHGHFSDLVVSGLTQDQIDDIGPMPQGHGLLGLVISEGQSLRLADLRAHSGSVGFPANHPPMRSLLAVPISASGNALGNLYLSETLSGRDFSYHDEQLLQRFASQAAVALLNARLHRQSHASAISTERERIARELHDSLAQVLAYAMTKSQAALAHLARNNAEAATFHIEQLHDAARDAYADVRENILGLRAAASPDLDLITALEEFVTIWRDQSGIPTTLVLPVEEDREVFTRHPASTRLQMLRIVQEATTNIRKHARASAVGITLGHGGSTTRLTIEDNGIGFAPSLLRVGAQPRFGLATMRERAESTGGTLEITSSSTGTTITLLVPVSRETHG